LQYPVQYWIEHALLAPIDVIEEFSLRHPFWADDSAARRKWWSFNKELHAELGQTDVTPLHVASMARFPAFVEYCKLINLETEVVADPQIQY
jgi:hypothetical protein